MPAPPTGSFDAPPRCVRVDVFTVLTPRPYAGVPRRGWYRPARAVYDACAMRIALVVAGLSLVGLDAALDMDRGMTFQQVVQVR